MVTVMALSLAVVALFLVSVGALATTVVVLVITGRERARLTELVAARSLTEYATTRRALEAAGERLNRAPPEPSEYDASPLDVESVARARLKAARGTEKGNA